MRRALPVPGVALPERPTRRYGGERPGGRTHRGVDFFAPAGTPFGAAAGGVVEHASNVWRPGFTGYGRHVVVRHPDDTRALYSHLDRVDVDVDQVVKLGQLIGTVGRTKFSKAGGYVDTMRDPAHLHFEVAQDAYPNPSKRLDPAKWFASSAKPPAILREVPRVEADAGGALLLLGGLTAGALWLTR